MFYRLLPVLTIIGLLIFVAFNFQNIRRELVYKLGISGDPTLSCCREDQISKTGDFDENASVAIFNGSAINYPKTSLAYANSQTPQPQVLGTTNATGEEKWIEVSLDEQKVRAWEGNKVVMEFLVSTGKWAPTPKGEYSIWYKTRNQVMSGGSKDLGTYYYLPNVPHNMFFYRGYAIHG
ncbi:L,D-transpeptidase, partial [Candidatus Daviesbacteria bacterium]|nr:L,D-transpeptidase [Candidatus Daviesbacteria bacterium]